MSHLDSQRRNQRAPAVIIYQEPGLYGLEIWRGIARNATLFQLRERAGEYFPALRDFLIQLHHGEAVSDNHDETIALRQAAGFVRVVFCGGGALAPSLKTAFDVGPLPFDIEIDTSGPFSSRGGAGRIFRSKAWSRGVALDLGQTQLKLITTTGNTIFERDTLQLPFGARSLETTLGQTRLRAWLAQAVSQLEPDGVVLGLPVELAPNGVAKASTYPGLFGPIGPIFAGLFKCPMVALNDAVLAALGFPPRSGEKTLVVTIGYGVGGALWCQ